MADLVRADLEARGLAGVRGQRGVGRGAARADLRDGRDRAGRARGPRPTRRRERIVIRPPSADGGDDFTVTETRADGLAGARQRKPERWVRQTDFSNDEAVGFLADRLNRLGVEARLVALGAVEGDAVLIGHRRQRRGLRLPARDRRRRRDARPSRRGPAVRGVATGAPDAVVRSTRRCPSAARARPGPTWPAGSTRSRPRPDELRDRLGRRPRPRDRDRERPRGMTGHARRERVAAARRVVVKVGSSSLTTTAGGIDPARVRRLVDVLAGGAGTRRRGRPGVLRVRSRPGWPRSG